MEDRRQVLCDYFNVEPTTIDMLLGLPHGPDRFEKCKVVGVEPHILRTMLEYSRYFEAEKVLGCLMQQHIAILGLRVLDFGCLVADYGLFFARQNAIVSLYDFSDYLKFATYRFSPESHAVRTFPVPTDFSAMFPGIDLAIFGEVLEHLPNPVEPLQACVDHGVQYIFTSCYPFGNDAYFRHPGHCKSAQDLQPRCIELLNRHYAGTNTHKNAWFWMRRTA